MVDALRRAHRAVVPDGAILDLHPTATDATVELGGQVVGYVDAGDASARHAAATHAIQQILVEQLADVTFSTEFTFLTYGDSIDELREYVIESWRDATISRTIQSAGKACIREHVRLTKLHPRGGQNAYNPPQ